MFKDQITKLILLRLPSGFHNICASWFKYNRRTIDHLIGLQLGSVIDLRVMPSLAVELTLSYRRPITKGLHRISRTLHLANGLNTQHLKLQLSIR